MEPPKPHPRWTLNLVVREIMGHAKNKREYWDNQRKLLKAAGVLVASAYDLMSNPKRVQVVREALEILDC